MPISCSSKSFTVLILQILRFWISWPQNIWTRDTTEEQFFAYQKIIESDGTRLRCICEFGRLSGKNSVLLEEAVPNLQIVLAQGGR